MSKLRMGTSGWSYDNWIGKFYPDGTSKSEMLDYYVSQFNSVEINATFYRLPFENMVKGWRNKAPDDFSYSVKGNRRITHYNKLQDIDDYLQRFLERIQQLGPALETIFWQFPPSFEKDVDRLENFVRKLPEKPRFAFEFRDTSWLDDEVYQLLEEHNSAMVWQSSGTFPDDCTVTADFIYIRFHGLEGGYKYSYSKSDLEPWADIIQKQLNEERDVHVYFNNTGGNAAKSVEMMKNLLG